MTVEEIYRQAHEPLSDAHLDRFEAQYDQPDWMVGPGFWRAMRTAALGTIIVILALIALGMALAHSAPYCTKWQDGQICLSDVHCKNGRCSPTPYFKRIQPAGYENEFSTNSHGEPDGRPFQKRSRADHQGSRQDDR